MNSLTASSGIRLRRIVLDLHIGVSEEERSQKQPIFIDILLRFTTTPLGYFTDNLDDTYCYDKLIQHIIAETQFQAFQLIERLAAHIYTVIQNFFGVITHRILVIVTKNPQQYIPQLTGGVECMFGDEMSWSF